MRRHRRDALRPAPAAPGPAPPSAQAGQQQAAWRARKATGRIREGHGDLHAANLVVLDDPHGAAPPEVTASDCIEFDPALRWIDVARDMAFAVMDLAAHGRPDHAYRLLNAWLDATGDHAGLAVLRFSLVERVLVRALVAQLRRQEAPSTATTPDYVAFAAREAKRHDAQEDGVDDHRTACLQDDLGQFAQARAGPPCRSLAVDPSRNGRARVEPSQPVQALALHDCGMLAGVGARTRIG